MDQNPVIYLTGAPATGKSTVAASLAGTFGARTFSYGTALAERLAEAGHTHEELREKSSAIVPSDLVAQLDSELPALLAEWRSESAVVIDSHAVTSETWGLRGVPYGPGALEQLRLSHLVCLIADAQTLISRIEEHSDGRRIEDRWKLDQLGNAQAALAVSYGHSLGVPVHMVDARPTSDEVAVVVAAVCGLLHA